MSSGMRPSLDDGQHHAGRPDRGPRVRVRARWFVPVVIAAVCAAAASGTAATSSTVISVTVPSATNLDASACESGVAGRTDFGNVLPGTSTVTSSDCTITFGSSNDTAKLRIQQTDRRGVAM